MAPTHPSDTAPPRAESEYPLLDQASMGDLLELIDTNLKGQNFSALNLSKIKVPSGGGREFLVQTAAGEESERTIEGVIAAYRQTRVYWKRIYGSGGGTKPPDCTSLNGLTGVGDPGGNCPACRYAQFGSALNPDGSPGPGQACKDIRQLLIVLPGQLLPHVLNLPPTSIKNFLSYSLHLVSSATPHWGVITKLSLETTKSQGGINYARVNFSMLRKLTPEQLKSLKPYHQSMRGLLEPMQVDASIFEREAPAAPASGEEPRSARPVYFPGSTPSAHAQDDEEEDEDEPVPF